jgi:hypothetical protein
MKQTILATGISVFCLDAEEILQESSVLDLRDHLAKKQRRNNTFP